MREILFRAKGKGSGKWLYGYYARLSDVTGMNDVLYAPARDPDDSNHTYGIIPDTIGQYTGLTDKNGKKIFEGDIVRYTFDSPDDPTATENGLKVRVGRVFWSDWRVTFAVTAGRRGSAALNNDVSRYVRGRSIYEYVQGANTVEVIGNIHDNPELLEGGIT